MLALVQKLASQGTVTRQEARTQTSKPAARPRPFVFAFRPRAKTFRLRSRFSKSKVDRAEIIEALEHALRELRSGAK
jgi:hypothetical protein